MIASLIAPLIAAVSISVTTDPPKPGSNLLPEGYCGFASSIVFSKEKKSVYRNVSGIVKPGRTYALSCEIKPTAEVAGNPRKTSGLGCSLTFWDKDWKRAVSLAARGDGPDRWQRVVSEKVEIPDWIVHGQLTVGIAYSKGGGEVRNIELVEADYELVIEAKADRGIMHVKVADENSEIVFDSGMLSGKDTVWTRRIDASPFRKYTAYVIDSESDVAFCKVRN